MFVHRWNAVGTRRTSHPLEKQAPVNIRNGLICFNGKRMRGYKTAPRGIDANQMAMFNVSNVEEVYMRLWSHPPN